MGKLFGTDGIRGRANAYPMTTEVAMKTGEAVGRFVLKNGDTDVVIGRDTRRSGAMLEAAAAAGAASAGATVRLAGIIPTPGVAYLCSRLTGVGAGIMISASHNPWEDNGLKIFKKGGIKLADTEEEGIEAQILGEGGDCSAQVGEIIEVPDACRLYARFLLRKFPHRKLDRKLKLVIDCSNGAAFSCAPAVFNPDLFDPVFLHHEPDGMNINRDCGSQHTEDLKAAVLLEKADAGLAFDGDADRLIAVDEAGNDITGDRILAVCAAYMKSVGTLDNNIVVSTIMSNIGLVNTLKRQGIGHVMTDVGDRKVLEEMRRKEAAIGGEDSGHMIFLKDHSTGDGMLSALKLLEVMVATGKPLSELAQIMTVYPQVLMNVEVDASRPDFMEIDTIADAIKGVEARLGDQGRVLVRYSGTQPLLRVMVEGPEPELTRSCCEEICEAVRAAI